jgi:hypothetical protein
MHWVRAELEAQPEMVQDLVPAGRERLGDAQAVLTGGSATGSVYLAGFCVEMILKHAALRTEGLQPYESVRASLAPARGRLLQWLGPVDHESYHSLEFWALLLRETFRHRRGDVPAHIAQAVRRASQLHQGWAVALRYHSAMVSVADAQEFLRAAGWFGARAHELWR